MIDVSKYEKIGEYRDGKMSWLSTKKDNLVYLIMFGADGYIGSTINIHRRFSQYISALKKGKYDSKIIQTTFRQNNMFDIYVIASSSDEDELRKLENHYLKLLQPSLNSRKTVNGFYRVGLPRYTCHYCNKRFCIGSYGDILKSRKESETDIKNGKKYKDSDIIRAICPYCGHKMTIYIKKHYQDKGDKGRAMIDVSSYEKIGEYRDGEMVWISQKNENIVYLISFGNEFYIGSTVNIRNRFQAFTSRLKRGKCGSPKVQSAFDVNSAFDLFAIECTDRDNLRKREEFYINSIHPSLNIRTVADYWYRDSMPLDCRRHREKNRHRNISPLPTLHQKPDVKFVRHKKDRSNLKGVFAKIPLSMYRRLSNLKMERGDSIERMVAQAIGFYVDFQDGKYKTALTAGMI